MKRLGMRPLGIGSGKSPVTIGIDGESNEDGERMAP
jgi:hypothetical protein